MTWKWMNLGKRKQPKAVRLLSCSVRYDRDVRGNQGYDRSRKSVNFEAIIQKLPSCLKDIPGTQASESYI